jgi:hypothetical protein
MAVAVSSLRVLKALCADYVRDVLPGLAYVYDHEPGRLGGLPCVTMMSRRYDPTQAETGPHDDVIYEWRVRLYVALNDYKKAQDDLDDMIPVLLTVPRHNATMGGLVDFFTFFDPGGEPTFSNEDSWVYKDVIARTSRAEL